MDVLNIAELLLSPDEKNELHSSMELLEQSDHSAFYERNQSIIQSILFLETLEEFLDFSKENELDVECFCAAFPTNHIKCESQASVVDFSPDNFRRNITRPVSYYALFE